MFAKVGDFLVLVEAQLSNLEFISRLYIKCEPSNTFTYPKSGLVNVYIMHEASLLLSAGYSCIDRHKSNYNGQDSYSF